MHGVVHVLYVGYTSKITYEKVVLCQLNSLGMLQENISKNIIPHLKDPLSRLNTPANSLERSQRIAAVLVIFCT